MTTKLPKTRAVPANAPKKAIPKNAPKRAVPTAKKTTPKLPAAVLGVFDRDQKEKPKPKAPVRTVEEPREEAPKPVVTGGGESGGGQPRPADKPAPAEVQQTTIEALTKLEYYELYPLWKRLNKGKGDEYFTTLRKQTEVGTRYMRKAEALHRGTISKAMPERGALYCPYCMTYMPFHNDTYMGYVRCCGCGISTKDYHTRGDNPHTD